MMRYHVGVDVGKYRHHISILDLSRGDYYKAFSFTNDHDGFMDLVAALEKISSERSDLLIGVEACPYALNLTCFLMAMGFTLMEVNPFRAGQFRKAQGKKRQRLTR